MRVALVINTSWNIWNFRASLVRALQAAGHEVLAIAPPDDYSQRLETELGCRYVPILMENKGTNPLKDAALTARFYQIYRREKPDVVLHYTIKPNIYGSIAARLAGVPSINNVSGLGTVFIIKNFVSKVALGLYKFAFRFPSKVFFQNKDDRQLFLENGLVREQITGLLPGSGVEPEQTLAALRDVQHRMAPTRVLLVGPTAVDDDEQNDRIRALDGALAAEATVLGVPFVSVFAATEASDAWRHPMHEGDGFHPDAAGYTLLAGEVTAPLLAWLAT